MITEFGEPVNCNLSLLLLQPINMLCIQSCSCAHLGCNKLLFELPLQSHHSLLTSGINMRFYVGENLIFVICHFDGQLGPQQVVLTMSTCPNALSCCIVIDSLDICVNRLLNTLYLMKCPVSVCVRHLWRFSNL